MYRIWVALFARAWIEIFFQACMNIIPAVALFARAWIEMTALLYYLILATGRPLCEGVD